MLTLEHAQGAGLLISRPDQGWRLWWVHKALPKVREKDGKREVQQDVISAIKSNGTAKCSASVQPVASRDSSVVHVQTCRSQIWPGRGRRRCWQRRRSDVYLQTEGVSLKDQMQLHFSLQQSLAKELQPQARSRCQEQELQLKARCASRLPSSSAAAPGPQSTSPTSGFPNLIIYWMINKK